MHKFQYSDFFQNRCQDAYSLRKLTKESPNTYLVHSKAAFMGIDMKHYRDLYVSIVKLPPNLNDPNVVAEVDKFSSGKTNIRDLISFICKSKAYVKRVKEMGDIAVSRKCIEQCGDPKFVTDFEKIIPDGCLVYAKQQPWKDFSTNNLYLWTSDLRAEPFACNVDIWKEASIVGHAEVDGGNCQQYKKTCRKRLKVFSNYEKSGYSLDPCPNNLKRNFFQAYRNDAEMSRVDVVMCSYPASNCELYMPFNKTLLVYVSTRLEFGRFDPFIEWRKRFNQESKISRLMAWIDNLQRISSNPRHIIAATNPYDVAYTKYFTGIEPKLIQPWCGSVVKPYGTNGKTGNVIVTPLIDAVTFPESKQDNELWNLMSGMWERQLKQTPSKRVFKFVKQLDANQMVTLTSNYDAVIFIPFDVSVFTLVEVYRSGIPIFVPSKTLLLVWHERYKVMSHRKFGNTPQDLVSTEQSDPNSEEKKDLERWFGLANFYHMPHIVTFDSWNDLIEKMEQLDLGEVSKKMQTHNTKERQELIKVWSDIKQHIVQQTGGIGSKYKFHIPLQTFDKH